MRRRLPFVLWIGFGMMMMGLISARAQDRPKPTLQELVNQLGPDEEILRVDDMLFRVEALRKTADGITDDGLPSWLTLWPDGVAYYQYDGDVSNTTREKFNRGFADWHRMAGVEFRPRTNQSNYIQIIEGTGNFSFLGMSGGAQTLSVTPGAPIGTVIHELGHALGLIHEHQRADRDQYVQILEENVEEGFLGNFFLQEGPVYTRTIYDFSSVMHYPPTAFSRNGQLTIEPLAPYAHQLFQMGQRDSLAFYDAVDITHMYAYRPPVLLPRLFQNEVELKWGQVPGIAQYHVQIARDVLFQEIVLDQQVGASGIAPFETVSLETTSLLPSTTHYWRVQSVHPEQTTAWTQAAKFITQRAAPEAYWLYPTYPNPARAEVQVPYELERPVDVQIRVFNALGQEVAVLASGRQTNGLYDLRWQADGHPAGLYFVQFRAGNQSQIRKVLLVR